MYESKGNATKIRLRKTVVRFMKIDDIFTN